MIKNLLVVMSIVVLLLIGCNAKDNKHTTESETKEKIAEDEMKGTVNIDGSSTVFPITDAIAEEFATYLPNIEVPIGVSGTGGGFRKFTAGESDINNASREIKEKEIKAAEKNGIKYSEVEVAYDGLTVAVNRENDWVEDITVEDLSKIWDVGSQVNTWKDVNPSWPDIEIKLYGPGSDSGTFEYFTHVINGDEGKIRSDYSPSEDDNILVQGIAGNKGALGFFGHAYYLENQDKIKALKVNGVEPNVDTIRSGKYSPLSRPLLIYVSQNSLESKPEVKAFVKYYLENAEEIVPDVGYVPLAAKDYKKALNSLIK